MDTVMVYFCEHMKICGGVYKYKSILNNRDAFFLVIFNPDMTDDLTCEGFLMPQAHLD